MKNKFIALLIALALLLTACSNSDDHHDTQIDIAPDTTEAEPVPTEIQPPKPQITEIETVVDLIPEYQYAVSASVNMDYEFTEEDRELQEILRELDPAWSVFASLYSSGTCDAVKGSGIGIHTKLYQYEDLFYLELSEELPFHTLEEMETELGRYFTKNIVKLYMSLMKASAGRIAWVQDGVYTVTLTEHEYIEMNNMGSLTDFPAILELDGKLYRAGAGYHTFIPEIDYSLAKVLRRTDDEIDFVYMLPVPRFGTELIAVKGRLKYDGRWKYCRLPLYNNEYLKYNEAYDLGEIPILYGNYDRDSLGEFDYGGIMADTRECDGGSGDFLDQGYSDFKELYQRAYALVRCLDHPGGYLKAAEGTDGKCSLQVPLEYNYGEMVCYQHYLFTGYSWDSFYSALTEVFTEEMAEVLAGSSVYNYGGALWYYMTDGLYSVPTHLHDEYSAEMIDGNTLDITRTSYFSTIHTGWDTEFDPQLMEQYDTELTHIIFVNTEKGWRCERFDRAW